MDQATKTLNKVLIISCMEAVDAWEQWNSLVPTGATKAMNSALIRLSKGAIKAWRLFLIDKGKIPGGSLHCVQSPTISHDKE